MGKLLKFLKLHAGAVLAILCVLMVQAWCDLSLPTYTSDIVNVGIQQGGVDESVPEQISGDELEKTLTARSRMAAMTTTGLSMN